MHIATRCLEVVGPAIEDADSVLTPAALEFVTGLVDAFAPRVRTLLARRLDAQRRYDRGQRPRFLDETRRLRDAEWTVAGIPADLQDRRVEITGPVDRKMIINGLNSGANVYMADFEDSNAPTWANVVEGQKNLRDAVAGDIRYVQPGTGKSMSSRRRPPP